MLCVTLLSIPPEGQFLDTKQSGVWVECGPILDILIIFTDGSSQVESGDPPFSYGRS